jgi:hypothetical protein
LNKIQQSFVKQSMTHTIENKKQQLLREFFLNASLIALVKEAARGAVVLQQLEQSPLAGAKKDETKKSTAAA